VIYKKAWEALPSSSAGEEEVVLSLREKRGKKGGKDDFTIERVEKEKHLYHFLEREVKIVSEKKGKEGGRGATGAAARGKRSFHPLPHKEDAEIIRR